MEMLISQKICFTIVVWIDKFNTISGGLVQHRFICLRRLFPVSAFTYSWTPCPIAGKGELRFINACGIYKNHMEI
jgi:hypothetical protein